MELTPKSEYSQRFLDGMVHRMGISYHKYGPIKKAFPHKVNALESLQLRLREYQNTGNTEFLIDAANFAMIEFMLPAHDTPHFTPTDSTESPGRKWHAGGPPNQRAN